MPRVINPIELIKKHLNQNFNLFPRNEDEVKILHQGIIMGGAILLNDLNGITDYCWNKNYGSTITVRVILKAIEELEEELDCYNQEQTSNRNQLFEKWGTLLDDEEKTGGRVVTLLD